MLGMILNSLVGRCSASWAWADGCAVLAATPASSGMDLVRMFPAPSTRLRIGHDTNPVFVQEVVQFARTGRNCSGRGGSPKREPLAHDRDRTETALRAATLASRKPQ